MCPRFLEFHYPRYWHFDLLFGLVVMAGVKRLEPLPQLDHFRRDRGGEFHHRLGLRRRAGLRAIEATPRRRLGGGQEMVQSREARARRSLEARVRQHRLLRPELARRLGTGRQNSDE